MEIRKAYLTFNPTKIDLALNLTLPVSPFLLLLYVALILLTLLIIYASTITIENFNKHKLKSN